MSLHLGYCRRMVIAMVVATISCLVSAGAGALAAETAPAGPPAAAGITPTQPNAVALLRQAKQATGGDAWDGLRSQHSVVHIQSGTRQAQAERWASVLTGRSRMVLEVDGTRSVIGYDGFVSWSQQGDKVALDMDPVTARLAVNTAYRDRLAFWFPDRQRARVDVAGRENAGGIDYDVVAITPEGGTRYELWISTVTHRIERLREPEYSGLRTEIYNDFREVQGVMVPFAVRVVREDPRYDERYTVERLEYNVPLDGIEFEMPRSPK